MPACRIHHHDDYQDYHDDDHVTPAGVKLDHHGVLERLADDHVHVEEREFPYSTVKLVQEQAFDVSFTFGRGDFYI